MTTWIIVGLVLTVLVQHRRIKQLSERLDDTRRESHVFQYETFERLHAVEKDVKRITGGTDTPSGSASCGSGPQVFDV